MNQCAYLVKIRYTYNSDLVLMKIIPSGSFWHHSVSLPMPSQPAYNVGHHRPTSEMPFKWCFASGPMVSLYWRFTGIIQSRADFQSTLNACKTYMSRDLRFPTMWYVRPAKAQTSLRPGHMRSLIRAFASRLNILCVLS